MKINALISILCFFSFALYAQNDLYEIDVIPPAPTSSALNKYIDYPVSLYTGTVDINIPLWEVNQGSLNVPISLSYHSSGIKVSDVASWVGLGWSLNAGGEISRNVRGLPDEEGLNAFYSSFDDELDESPVCFDSPIYESNSCYGLLNGFYNGPSYDYLPDFYYYHSPTGSGKFFMDRKPPSTTPNNFAFFDNNGTDILESSNGSFVTYGFEAIDPSGIIYEFSDIDTVYSKSNFTGDYGTGSVDYETYPSAWHLTSMTAANGVDEIKFFYYDSENCPYTSGISDVVSTTTGVTPNSCGVPIPTPSTIVFDTATMGTSKTTTTPGVKRLRAIAAKNYLVYFNVGGSRTDYSGASKLESIEVYYKESGISFTESTTYLNLLSSGVERIKKYEFEYEFSSPNPRMFLDQLVEVNSEGDDKVHEFTYNSESLPDYESDAIDHWGYYNGATSNTHLIPTFTFDTTTYQGANRRVNTTKAKAGILEEIKYPTGGSTKLYYESNMYKTVCNKENTFYDKGSCDCLGQVTTYTNLNSFPSNNSFDNSNFNNPNSACDELESEFPAATTSNSSTHQFTPTTDNVMIKYYGDNGYELSPQNPQGWIMVYEKKYGESTYNSIYCSWIHNENIYYVNSSLFTADNTYKVILVVNSTIIDTPQVHAEITYDQTAPSCELPDEMPVGGLRVYRIENKDSNGDVEEVRRYTYEKPTNEYIIFYDVLNLPSGVSSLVLNHDLPSGFRTSSVTHGSCTLGSPPSTTISTYTVTTTGFRSNGMGKEYKNNTPFYSDVFTYFGDAPEEQIGYLYQKYKSEPDYVWDISNGGKLIKEKYFRKCGETGPSEDPIPVFSIVSDKTYSYEIETLYNSDQLLIDRYATGYPIPNTAFYGVTVIYYTIGQSRMKTQIVKSYDDTCPSSNTLTTLLPNQKTTTQYYYDNMDHFQLTEEEVTLPNTDVISTIYQYPLDFAPFDTEDESVAREALGALNDAHILNAPVSRTVIKNSEVVSSQYLEYNEEALKPEKIYKLEATEPLTSVNMPIDMSTTSDELVRPTQYGEHRVVYTYYDDSNDPEYRKPKTMQQTDGTITEFLWSTDGQRLIEKKIYADDSNVYLSIAYDYNEDTGMLESITDEKGLVTTYEYDALLRLKRVIDHNGHVLSEYEYNYEN